MLCQILGLHHRAAIGAAVCLSLLAGLSGPTVDGARAGEAEGARSQPVVVRVAADAPWGGQIRDVEAVLCSAANELWRFFPQRTLDPILVEPKGGPIVLYDRGAKGEYRVLLNTGNRLWAQHAYQFAHEFCHILCNYNAGRDHCNKWFEESLCEMASMFALRRMSQTWKSAPPYPNWKDYSIALSKYADDLIERGRLPEGKTLEAWFRENADVLYSNAGLREKNSVVAASLLPLFEREPQHWAAIGYLYSRKPEAKQPLASLLKAWRDACPEEHQAFVGQIARQFGQSAERHPPAEPVSLLTESENLHITAAGDGPWADQVRDVEAVLNSAGGELWRYFPGRKISGIRVEPRGGPILLSQRGPQGEYTVRLNTGERLWAQHAYQFAYLFGRILCNSDSQEHRNKWFEDSLCQTAAVFALRRMAQTWKTNPPYPQWRDYSLALASYADGVLEPGKLPAGVAPAEWFRQHAAQLYEHREMGDSTNVVAAMLLPLLEQKPENWNAVTYINTPEAAKAQTFDAFLGAWRRACPEQHRGFVSDIAAKFGIRCE